MNASQSTRIAAAVLTALFGARLLLFVTDVLAALMALHAPVLYDRFGKPLDRLWVATPWIYMVWIGVFGVWVFMYHRDLRRLVTEYPITPWGAVARVFIPLFNVWGFWITWATAQKHFDAGSGRQPRLQLRHALLIFYVGWLVMPTLKSMPVLKGWVWFPAVQTFVNILVYGLLFWAASRTLNLVAPASPEPAAEAS